MFELRSVIQFLCIMLLVVSILPKEAIASRSTEAFQNVNQLSTWLWDTEKIVTEPDMIINNLVAHKVSDVYLQINASVQIESYKNFISKASTYGIKVHALDGAPTWVTNQKGITQQNTFLNWLVNYQAIAAENERFIGIHLDVEPYENANYEKNANNLFKNYQAMILTFREKADRMGLEFGIDIPFWYYGVNYNNIYGKGNIAEWLCKNVEYISIMAYRDSANGSKGNDGVIAIAAAQMNLFEKYNVKGTIAVETGRLGKDSDFVTFYEEDADYLYNELNIIYDHYKATQAFNGIAIHYYDSWMAMK